MRHIFIGQTFGFIFTAAVTFFTRELVSVFLLKHSAISKDLACTLSITAAPLQVSLKAPKWKGSLPSTSSLPCSSADCCQVPTVKKSIFLRSFTWVTDRQSQYSKRHNRIFCYCSALLWWLLFDHNYCYTEICHGIAQLFLGSRSFVLHHNLH